MRSIGFSLLVVAFVASPAVGALTPGPSPASGRGGNNLRDPAAAREPYNSLDSERRSPQ